MSSLAKVLTTSYAPDIQRALNGILLVHKPVGIHSRELDNELRHRISESLQEFEPRPLAQRLQIRGGLDEEKQLVQVPDYSDHPLVIGPRYLPWEVKITHIKPLGIRSSGVSVLLLGHAYKMFATIMRRTNLVNVYHLKGKFGYMTNNCLSDGKILDKFTYRHIRSGKLDATLARIQATQQQRLFDSTNLPHHSQEAYQAALAWPLRPPQMADWPLIFRLRCIHLKLPDFTLEVVIVNENEHFLAQLVNDVGALLKSGAFTESIRRVKYGPFHVNNSLTDKEWNLQSIINNLDMHNSKKDELLQMLKDHRRQAIKVKTAT